MKLCIDFWAIRTDESGETSDQEPTPEEAENLKALIDDLLTKFFEMELEETDIEQYQSDMDDVWTYKGTWWGMGSSKIISEPNPEMLTDLWQRKWWF
jgi:hypothetical protein